MSWAKNFYTARDRSRAAAVGWALLAVAASAGLLAMPAAADERPTISVQGSTTFNSRILQPHKSEIEDASGVKLDVVPNKSIWGLIALFEKRADLAMMSADLNRDAMQAKATAPGLAFEKLRQFEVARVDVAIVAHPKNPVRKLSKEQLVGILRGEITNWKDVGGDDMPIRVVATQNGGGTVMALRAQVLNGGEILAKDAAVLESAWHVVQAVAQLPGALGVAQTGLARRASVNILDTGSPVEQTLTFVTYGDPEPNVMAVIKATQKVIEKHPL